MSSIETTIRNLHRLAKTFQEICSSLTTQILMLSGKLFIANLIQKRSFLCHSDANDRVSAQELESIAYQACDKVYKNEDNGPYDSLW